MQYLVVDISVEHCAFLHVCSLAGFYYAMFRYRGVPSVVR